MLRFRMVGRSGRILRKPMYQVEESLTGTSEWVPVGELDGHGVAEAMDPDAFDLDRSWALSQTFEAFKAGDRRGVYPGYRPLDEPPSE